MTNPLDLPKTEDVNTFDLGNTTVHLVEINKDNAKYLARLATLITIEGRQCRYCKVEFTPEDIEDIVGASHPGESFQLAHSECWKRRGQQS